MNVETAPDGFRAVSFWCRRLRWWQWLLMVLPAVVMVVSPWIVVAVLRARDEASGFTYLTEHQPRFLGLRASFDGLGFGIISCLVCGVVLGLTTKVQQRITACFVWPIWLVLVNVPLAWGGCALESLIDARLREKAAHRSSEETQ